MVVLSCDIVGLLRNPSLYLVKYLLRTYVHWPWDMSVTEILNFEILHSNETYF